MQAKRDLSLLNSRRLRQGRLSEIVRFAQLRKERKARRDSSDGDRKSDFTEKIDYAVMM